jgi:hypothetical protein
MACGSGSFLIYAYQVLADFYRREIERLDAAWHARYRKLIQEEYATPLVAQTDPELLYCKRNRSGCKITPATFWKITSTASTSTRRRRRSPPST